ncbi:DUF58 domain-containing protein [bacterium]|nr:DUF58 domain-containing protein [bacterium]
MQNTGKHKFLSPKFANSLNIRFVAKQVVEGAVSGFHKSPFRGFNVEFSEHRQYMPGDEIKNIDWKIFAKTEKYYIKQYEEETDLRAYLLLDTSTSMTFSSPEMVSKLDYACYLAASLAYLLLKQGDSIGMVLFNDKITDYLPPRGTPSHCNLIFDKLESIKPEPVTGIADSFHELADRIKRRGVVFIFSDFYDDVDKITNAIRHFRHKKHEVVVFHLFDPIEKNLNIKGDTLFVDLETNEEILLNPSDILSIYQKERENFVNKFKELANEVRIDYNEVFVDEPYEFVLQKILKKRLKGRL